jgi:catechol 2,3-dioxygenase-like lactoylglutathione lyase family enzyme
VAIKKILLNVEDTERSVEFYTRFLRARLIGEVSADRAVLDVITAQLELTRPGSLEESTWIPDDLQRGFRHVGFKVDNIDALVRPLKEAGVRFHLDPLDAEGEVRIAFFYDPDGTLLEVVEGPLRYHVVYDEAGVRADWALGVPERPRFDHVAVTASDLDAIESRYAPFGYANIGHINQLSDPRGFGIDFLKAGDNVLEIFTFDAEKSVRAPQLAAPGFAGVVFDAGPTAAGSAVGAHASGHELRADADGLVFAVEGGPCKG